MIGKLSVAVLFALLASSAYAAGVQPDVVYTFTCNGSPLQRVGRCPNGAIPYSLLQGSDGNFYGNAQASSEGRGDQGGTVFSVTPGGKFTVLHTFYPGANKMYSGGNNPGLLIEGSDGKLYGTTGNGGVNNGANGYGVFFRINKNGSGFRVVHKFCSEANCADGVGPQALVAGTDGNLYGATFSGGTGNCGGGGCGAIFRVTPSSKAYDVVFNFNGTTDGYEPTSLILGPGGSLYGNSGFTFEYTPATGNFQILPLKFPTLSGGSVALVGPNGNFYGLYFTEGKDGMGLFEVQTDGNNLQLFPFYNTIPAGGTPSGGMLLGSDGNFWLADYHGRIGYGDIISLSPSDGTVLQTFTPFNPPAAVGAYPAGIIQAKDGTFWGSTTDFGDATKGHFGAGTVFSLNAGLPRR